MHHVDHKTSCATCIAYTKLEQICLVKILSSVEPINHVFKQLYSTVHYLHISTAAKEGKVRQKQEKMRSSRHFHAFPAQTADISNERRRAYLYGPTVGAPYLYSMLIGTRQCNFDSRYWEQTLHSSTDASVSGDKQRHIIIVSYTVAIINERSPRKQTRLIICVTYEVYGSRSCGSY